MVMNDLLNRMFSKQGYLVVDRFVNADVAAALAEIANTFLSSQGRSRASGGVVTADGLLAWSQEANLLLRDSGLLSDSTGDSAFKLLIEADNCTTKKGGFDITPPWHQDANFNSEESGVALYLALSGDDSGSLEVVPGSNLLGLLEHKEGSLNSSADTWSSRSVELKLSLGAMVFLHPHLVHRGLANSSSMDATSLTMWMKQAA